MEADSSLEELSVATSILQHIAINNSSQASLEDRTFLLNNRPAASSFRSTAKKLVTRYRRNIGSSFFADYNGECPAPNREAQERELELNTVPKLHDLKYSFTSSDDANLKQSVARVYRFRTLRSILEKYKLTLPDIFIPLGNVSVITLPNVGPRSETQFLANNLLVFSLEALAGFPELSMDEKTSLSNQVQSLLNLSDDELCDIAPIEEIDWIHIAFGGFLRPRLAATPHDLRVYWSSQLKPQLRGDLSQTWSKREDSLLLQVAEARELRRWDEIASEVGGGARSVASVFQRYHHLRALQASQKVSANKHLHEVFKSKLLQLAGEHGTDDFVLIASFFDEPFHPDYLQKMYKQFTTQAVAIGENTFDSEEILKPLKKSRSSSRTRGKMNFTVEWSGSEDEERNEERESKLWTLEDDAKLVFLSRIYGQDYESMSIYFEGRTKDQLRERSRTVVETERKKK
jgi:hypothetical protein